MLGYTVAPNPSSSTRTATLTIGGATFTVNQNVAGTVGGSGNAVGGAGTIGGSDCAVGVDPLFIFEPLSGGPGSFTISASAGCAWSVVPNVSWIHIVQRAGLGTATIQVTIDPAGNDRLGMVDVGGQSITIAQTGDLDSAVALINTRWGVQPQGITCSPVLVWTMQCGNPPECTFYIPVPTIRYVCVPTTPTPPSPPQFSSVQIVEADILTDNLTIDVQPGQSAHHH